MARTNCHQAGRSDPTENQSTVEEGKRPSSEISRRNRLRGSLLFHVEELRGFHRDAGREAGQLPQSDQERLRAPAQTFDQSDGHPEREPTPAGQAAAPAEESSWEHYTQGPEESQGGSILS